MNRTKQLAYGGMLAAIIMVATAYLKFPTTLGYIHLGDGAIFLASAVLGPIGGLCAAVGSALADVLAGYTLYAPVTFVIKGIMGFVAGYFLKKQNRSTLFCAVMLFLLSAFMVGGYFLFEAILYGIPAALPSAAFNCIQGAAGILIGLFAVTAVNKLLPHK